MYLIDPFGLFKNFILQPALGTAALFGLYNARSEDIEISDSRTPPSTRDIAIKATFLAFATAFIIWASIFMYIAFYYTYMPAIEHIRTVHMQYEYVFLCAIDPFL